MIRKILFIAVLVSFTQGTFAQQSQKSSPLPKTIAAVDSNLSFIDQMSIYPNPASSNIEVSNLSKKTVVVTVFNIVGDVLMSKQSSIKNISFDISKLPDGVYIVAFNNGEEVVTQRLVKYS